MTFKMIYFVGLILLAKSLSCFPNRTPKGESSCNWPYITGCLTNFKPIFDFKPYFPVLRLNLNKDEDDKQMNRMPFSFPGITENERSDFGNNEKQDSFHHVSADQSSKNISEDKINKVTITNPKSKNIINNDFIVFNTETSTDSEINTEYTTYYENDNTITTTEEQDGTTEELSFRLSDLPPAVIASFLG
ncbi:uncharacterized protein LOC113393281 [Vanessa tameamea]|uniref:Uncharacterized protein LOC113393281 n=1 Tax=Vanessa tameamea TaxID=334116 RepID=A0A8B8HLZ8_VANTA